MESGRRRLGRIGGWAAVLACVAFAASGCDNSRQGAASGAAIGALSGLAIGSLSGNAGTGAAIGAIAGGAGGAVIGDQNRRRDQQTAAMNSRPAPAPAPAPVAAPAATPQMSQADRDRMVLSRFARSWQISGWETVEGVRRFASGTAVGAVESNYFVRLEMRMTAEGADAQQSTGTIIFGSEPGRGLTMSSRFDSSPSAMNYAGNITDGGNAMTLDEIHPAMGGPRRRIEIRFLGADEFVADVKDVGGRSGAVQASFRFTGVR